MDKLNDESTSFFSTIMSFSTFSLYRGSLSHLSVPVTTILRLLSEDIMEWPWDDGAIWCMLHYSGGISSTTPYLYQSSFGVLYSSHPFFFLSVRMAVTCCPCCGGAAHWNSPAQYRCPLLPRLSPTWSLQSSAPLTAWQCRFMGRNRIYICWESQVH